MSSASTHLILLPLSSGVHSMTYMDYILNPCSVIQVSASISTASLKVLLSMSREVSVRVALQAFDVNIIGEVVSYSVSASSNVGALVSMLLMPPGIARPFPGAKFGHNLFADASTVKPMGGSRTVSSDKALRVSTVGTRYPVSLVRAPVILSYDLGWDRFPELNLDVFHADSVYSIVMKYRKAYLIRAVDIFNRSQGDNRSMQHRLVYFTFPLIGRNPSGAFDSKSGHVLFGDINLSNSSTSPRALGASINPNTMAQYTYAFSNQGLLNNAYYHIPRESPSLASHSSHIVNEILDVGTQDLGQASQVFRNMVGNANAQDSLGNMFETFSVNIDAVSGIVPWGTSESARHIRSIFTYTGFEGGQADPTGITARFTLARLNPGFHPSR